jgi:hypothetical protein
MTWKVPRMWENGEVWILGGGPSVPTQFDIPQDVIKGVIEKKLPPSAYSSYMSAIHNKHVIGINVAYTIGDWIDMVFFGDRGFFLRHQEGLANFPGLKLTCDGPSGQNDWVKYLGRDSKRTRGISTSPHLVSWNGNSGAAAISVAAWSGAKRIILLGFDMKLDTTKMQHWHDLYNRGVVATDKRMRALPFNRHLIGFEEIAKDAKRLGIEILNACPDSAIKQFRKVTVKELLQ